MNDLFAMQPAAPPVDEITVAARTYTLVPKTIAGEDRVGINWREGTRAGVIGCYFVDRKAAALEIQRRHP